MTAIVSITEVQRPGRQFDSGLSRRESGRGAAAVGLSGDVSAAQMEALFGHRIDPRDDRFDQPSEWGEAAQIGGPRRRYASAQELYERALNTEPDASGERREELRLNAERTARRTSSTWTSHSACSSAGERPWERSGAVHLHHVSQVFVSARPRLWERLRERAARIRRSG
jgi:hypothetical protein